MKKNKILSCFVLVSLIASMTACGAETAPAAPASETTTTASETTVKETETEKSDTTVVSTAKTEETTAEKKTEAASEGNASVKDIVSVWFEDALDARTLTIKDDGTFTLEYKGGGAKYGTVKIDYEEFGDGSKRAWYYLYEEDDTEWISFPENEDGEELTDIWSYEDGSEIHFRRDTAIRDGGIDDPDPNEYGYYPVYSTPETGVSIQALDGTWESEDGETIVFYDGSLYTGNFVITHPDLTIDEGYVDLEYSLNPDDSKEFWYNLYTFDGTFLLGFGVSGNIPLDDLYAGQSGDPHFSRISSVEGGNSSGGGDDFLGVWAVGRITATIDKDTDSDHDYTVDIHWSSSAADGSVWTYHCDYDDAEGVLRCNGLGTRTDYSYDEDGNYTDTAVYDGSNAVFEIKDGALYWDDDKEDMDEDVELLI